MIDIVGSFGRPNPATLGDASTDVAASIGPYAPFNSAAGAAQAAGLDVGSPEGQLATNIMSDLIDGNPIDVFKYAEEAGSVAGAAAGTAALPGIGTLVGGIVGGIVGKALGGLFGGGGGDSCDCVCTAQKQVTPVANQICVVRSTGAVDSTCRDSVYNVFLEHCQFMTALWPAAAPFGGIPLGGYKFQAQNDPNQDGRWHVFDDLLVKYKVPLDRDPDKIDASAQDANEQLLKARLGEIAATRRLDDDVSWAQKLIVAANSTAAEWAPKCPICEPACVHLVQKYAVDYATAAHPYGLIGDESVTEGPAKTSMLDGMAAAIATDKKCPTIAEAAKMKIKTTPLDQPSAGSTDATPKGHSIALKAVVTVGAAAAIYSAVQFARQKPNVIVDQSKKLIAKASAQ